MVKSLLMAVLLAASAHAADNLVYEAPPAFGDPAKWYTAECTLEKNTEVVPPGAEFSLRWHIDVDHTTGEPKYPIGWPRVGLSLTPPVDWSGYDFLTFKVYGDTSREAFPTVAFGLTVDMPARPNQHALSFSLAKREWRDITVPIEDLRYPKTIGRVGWHIGESNYSHLDKIDFYLADLKLGRYAAPQVMAMKPLEALVSTRPGYLVIDAQVAGVAEGATVEGLLTVPGKGGQRQLKIELRRGRQRLVAACPELAPGAAEVTLQVAGGATAKARIEVVTGPFEEVAR